MVFHCNDKIVNCTLVGDGMVGKTQICKTITGNQRSEEYEATVTGEFNAASQVMGDRYDVRIVDSSGQHDYKDIRTKSYKKTDVFIVCYNVTDRDSFESIAAFWMSEIRQVRKTTPIILVGTGTDIRDGNGNDIDSVSEAEGLRVLDKCGLSAFLVCSSHNKEQVQEIFEEAVLSVIGHRKRRRSSLLRNLLAR